MSGAIIGALKTFARKVNNYEKDATGSTAHWPDTTHYRATCPTGKRWFLLGGIVKPDVNADVTIQIKNSSDEALHQLHYQAASTNTQAYPKQTADYNHQVPQPAGFVLDEGDYVEITFGAIQSTNAYASCPALEVDV